MWSGRDGRIADAVASRLALPKASLRCERRTGGGWLCGEPVLAILLRGRVLRARTALQPDQFGEVASADRPRRDGKAAAGNDRGSATTAGAEAE